MLQEVKGDGHTMVNSDTRLCSSNAMRDAATNLVCKTCAVESREKGIVSYADGFEKYIAKHASKTDYKVAKKLLDAYRIQAKKSEIRQREIFKKKRISNARRGNLGNRNHKQFPVQLKVSFIHTIGSTL